MKRPEIAHLWYHLVCDLCGWGWSFTSGAKDISEEEILDWVNHFQWKWHANKGGFFSALLFRFCEKFENQVEFMEIAPADRQLIKTWITMNVRPVLQVMALELALLYNGADHWSLHGIPEPILECGQATGNLGFGIMAGGCFPDWVPTSLSRPNPANPGGPAPIRIIANLLPLQCDN